MFFYFHSRWLTRRYESDVERAHACLIFHLHSMLSLDRMLTYESHILASSVVKDVFLWLEQWYKSFFVETMTDTGRFVLRTDLVQEQPHLLPAPSILVANVLLSHFIKFIQYFSHLFLKMLHTCQQKKIKNHHLNWERNASFWKDEMLTNIHSSAVGRRRNKKGEYETWCSGGDTRSFPSL